MAERKCFNNSGAKNPTIKRTITKFFPGSHANVWELFAIVDYDSVNHEYVCVWKHTRMSKDLVEAARRGTITTEKYENVRKAKRLLDIFRDNPGVGQDQLFDIAKQYWGKHNSRTGSRSYKRDLGLDLTKDLAFEIIKTLPYETRMNFNSVCNLWEKCKTKGLIDEDGGLKEYV